MVREKESSCVRDQNDTIHLANDEVMITTVYDAQNDCRWQMSRENLSQVVGMVLHINGECDGEYVVGNDGNIQKLTSTWSRMIFYG